MKNYLLNFDPEETQINFKFVYIVIQHHLGDTDEPEILKVFSSLEKSIKYSEQINESETINWCGYESDSDIGNGEIVSFYSLGDDYCLYIQKWSIS